MSNTDPTIWEGDGLPDDDQEAIDILVHDLGMTQPELEGWIETNKREAWVREKVAKYEEDAERKEWYLRVARYYWRRVERLRSLTKKVIADVDEQIELVDTIIAKIKDESNTRDKIAYEYGWLLQSRHFDDIDWHRINLAISERWSPSAIDYIKNKAWKIVQAQAS